MNRTIDLSRHRIRSAFFHPVIYLFFLVEIYSASSTLKAQTNRSPSFFQRNVHLTGQSSIYGEVYGIHGADRRRPPSTGRIALMPTLRFSQFFTVSANLMLSTEGSSARQNMNIMGLHPAWKWGKAHIGDYSDHFSKYTFNGVNIRGAGIDLYPGKFRFTVGGGQSRRAVEGILVHESYAQYLFASRIGYGNKNSSFFDLIFLKAKDDPASITKPEDWDYTYVIPDTMETELDTLWIEPPYNPLSVTPQENMVVGFNSRIHFFQKRLVLEMEGDGSAYTKDLNATSVTLDSVEDNSLIRGIFGPIFSSRASTNFDFALNTQLGIHLRNLRLNVGFRHIGPGYFSLGIPSTINDRQEWYMNTGFKLGLHRIRFNWNRLSDNLLNQKQQTNLRNQFQTSVATITKRWRSQFDIRYLIMTNDAVMDSLEWSFNNLIISTHQSLVFDRDAILRQIGLQYTYQASKKEIASNPQNNHYHTVNLTTGLRFIGSMNMNASVGLSFRDSGAQGSYTTQVYSIRLSHIALKNKLNTSLFNSSSMVRDTHMIRTGITANYRLTSRSRLTWNFSYNHFQGARDFSELRSSVMLSHQF